MVKKEVKNLIWECSCGYREPSSESPDECPKCLSLDSFSELPEEFALEESLLGEVE